ncbi:hypothetical protein D3C76_1187330 [compost metagenome]
MWRCRALHLPQRVINVATVKLVIATHVDHRALEHLVRPLHAARFDINVTGEDDYVSVARARLERCELVVQV